MDFILERVLGEIIFLGMVNLYCMGSAILTIRNIEKCGVYSYKRIWAFIPFVNMIYALKLVDAETAAKRSYEQKTLLEEKNNRKKNTKHLRELLEEVVDDSFVNFQMESEQIIFYSYESFEEKQKLVRRKKVQQYIYLTPEKQKENVVLKGRQVIEPGLVKKIDQVISLLEKEKVDEIHLLLYQESEETFEKLNGIIKENLRLGREIDDEIVKETEEILRMFAQRMDARTVRLKEEEEKEKQQKIEELREKTYSEAKYQRELEARQALSTK